MERLTRRVEMKARKRSGLPSWYKKFECFNQGGASLQVWKGEHLRGKRQCYFSLYRRTLTETGFLFVHVQTTNCFKNEKRLDAIMHNLKKKKMTKR